MPSSSSSSIRSRRAFLTDRKRPCAICGPAVSSATTVRKAFEKYRGWKSDAKYLTVLSNDKERQSAESPLPRIWIQVTDTEDRCALDVHVVLDNAFEDTDVHPDTLRSWIGERLDNHCPEDTRCKDTMSAPHILHLGNLARSCAQSYMKGMGHKHPEGTYKIMSVVNLRDSSKHLSFIRALSGESRENTGISQAIESFRTESLRQREDRLHCSDAWTADIAGLIEIGLDGAITTSNIDHTMTSHPSGSNDVIVGIYSDPETDERLNKVIGDPANGTL